MLANIQSNTNKAYVALQSYVTNPDHSRLPGVLQTRRRHYTREEMAAQYLRSVKGAANIDINKKTGKKDFTATRPEVSTRTVATTEGQNTDGGKTREKRAPEKPQLLMDDSTWWSWMGDGTCESFRPYLVEWEAGSFWSECCTRLPPYAYVAATSTNKNDRAHRSASGLDKPWGSFPIFLASRNENLLRWLVREGKTNILKVGQFCELDEAVNPKTCVAIADGEKAFENIDAYLRKMAKSGDLDIVIIADERTIGLWPTYSSRDFPFDYAVGVRTPSYWPTYALGVLGLVASACMAAVSIVCIADRIKKCCDKEKEAAHLPPPVPNRPAPDTVAGTKRVPQKRHLPEPGTEASERMLLEEWVGPIVDKSLRDDVVVEMAMLKRPVRTDDAPWKISNDAGNDMMDAASGGASDQ